jgi:outer membrane protein assembly factor BamB
VQHELRLLPASVMALGVPQPNPPTGRHHRDAPPRRRFAVAALLATTLLVIAAPGGKASVRVALGAAPQGQLDWPKFHATPAITGATSETLLGATQAATLGLSWMANLQAFSYSSPVAVWDVTLGRMLVIAIASSGYMAAFDGSNGQVVWATNLGTVTYSTPLVSNGVLYIGMRGGNGLRAYDVSTGRLICNYPIGAILSSPTILNPDGRGNVLYVGTLSKGSGSGALVGVNTVTTSSTTCTVRSSYNKWGKTPGSIVAGLWAPTAAAFDATGRPLAVIGTDDPDAGVYAVDVATNQLAWRFQTKGTGDVGAGAVISPPGTNGVADGVVYVPGTDHMLYALDLTTGQQLWAVDFTGMVAATTKGGRSTVALVGNRVYDAFAGVFAFDAVTGAKVWSTVDNGLPMPELVSSPAVSGSSGDQVLIAADTAGTVHALRTADGQQVWSYQTGGYVYASPAVSNGMVFLTSTDGYLYAFAPGGGNSARPHTVISSPADKSNVSYPAGGNLMVTGSASDDHSVSRVLVAVQRNGSSGPWWNARTSSWSNVPEQDVATLNNPGAASTDWTYSFPIPVEGGYFTFFAEAVDDQGQGDPHQAHAAAFVGPAPGQPVVTISQSQVPPGGQLALSGSGFSAGERVTVHCMTTLLPSVGANSSGNLSGTLTIPASALPGLGALTFRGATSARATSTALIVSTPWTQFRFSAAHTGFEPNENVFNNSDANYLLEVWSHPAGGAVESSPAVANGVVYVGDDSGLVSALDRRTGSAIWTHNIGGAVVSSPAVTGSMIVVGSASGTVTALNAASGTVVWTFVTAGPVNSSPAVSGGIVYIGSDDGHVYALNATTGALVWSFFAGGTVESSPAVSGNSVFVGSTNGSVYALNAGNGVLQWSFATHGAVSSSATVSGGLVFIGSADHSVYALSVSTGAKLWQTVTGGPVASSPAVSMGMVVVGSDDHFLYALQTSNGAKVWTYATTGTVRSSPAVASNMVVFGSSDGLIYAVTMVGGHSLFKFDTGGQVTSSPTISDGVVYAASWSGSVDEFTPYGTQPE